MACCLALAGLVAAPEHVAAARPNDPLFKHQWQLQMLQVPRAWSVSRGRGVTVAVLDTGVAYEDRGPYRRAPDLAGTRFVPGYDFVDGDAHPNDEPTRLPHSHGTHIAGVIAQTTGNGIGAAGIAPEAAIMPVRVLRPHASGSARTIAHGLRFAADHGADVANVSIAGALSRPVLAKAIRYAASKGVTIVAATGNDGQSSVSFPAAYPEVIAVGALSRNMRLAYYSNYGRALDLVAPAGDDTPGSPGGKPDHGVVQQTLSEGRSTFCYCFMASTSAAAAEVSGVAALLIASGRAKGRRAVRKALLTSARDLGRRGRDERYGAGLVQAASALGQGARQARAHDRGSSGQPWLLWLALAMGAGGLAAVAGRSLRARAQGRRAAGR